MAIGKNVRFYVDGVDLACNLSNIDPEMSKEMLDKTTLCKPARTYVYGIADGSISASGFWDADTTNADEIDDVIKAAISNETALVVTYCNGTITAGTTPAIMGQDMKVESYGVNNSSSGALVEANVELKANNGLESGLFLYDSNTTSGTDNGTGVDNSASSSNGGLFQAHLYDQSDSTATGGSFTLQHSTNNSTWVDLVAATAVGSAVGSVQAVVAAGTTVNRYLRVQFTASGGKGYGVAAFIRR